MMSVAFTLRDIAELDAIRHDLDALIRRPPSEPSTAADARRRHMRRELGAALEHGFAMLDAFDLGPLALDMVDDAIAALDGLDAPDEDREPYLAGYYNPLVDPDGEREGDEDPDEDDGTAEEEPDDEDDDPAGGQQRDEDAPFWSLDVGSVIGAAHV